MNQKTAKQITRDQLHSPTKWDMNQDEQIVSEFQAWVDAGVWQGEDEFTKNIAIGNVTDYWMKIVKRAREEGREELKAELLKHVQYLPTVEGEQGFVLAERVKFALTPTDKQETK